MQGALSLGEGAEGAEGGGRVDGGREGEDCFDGSERGLGSW